MNYPVYDFRGFDERTRMRAAELCVALGVDVLEFQEQEAGVAFNSVRDWEDA